MEKSDYHQRFRDKFVPAIFGDVEAGDKLTIDAENILAFIDEVAKEAYEEGSATCRQYKWEWIEKAAADERIALITVVKMMKKPDIRCFCSGNDRCIACEVGIHNDALDDVLAHLQADTKSD